MLQYNIFGDIIETDGFGNPVRYNNNDNHGFNACNMCYVVPETIVVSYIRIKQITNMDQYEINWDIPK